MPHVAIKMYPGRTEEQKKAMTEGVTDVLMKTLNVPLDSISVSVEEIDPEDWNEKVYKPEIEAKKSALYKKPGYKSE